MADGLFPDEPDEPKAVEPVTVIPWTPERGIAVFLNRWSWRGDREVVERELRELIEDCKR